MPRKPKDDRPGKDRPKARAKLEGAEAEALKASVAAFRKRRNRRYLFLGLIALSFPLIEAIAYQYRAIEITVVNNFREPITRVKVVYPGGQFEEAEIKPEDSITRTIRPDFTFKSQDFSTYKLDIRFFTAGGFFHQYSKAGTIDYSAREIYTVVPSPPAGQADLQHVTKPGFPLGTVREVLKRLGLG